MGSVKEMKGMVDVSITTDDKVFNPAVVQDGEQFFEVGVHERDGL